MRLKDIEARESIYVYVARDNDFVNATAETTE